MRKILKNLILVLLGTVVVIASSVVTLIYGWGLTPKNWWIIVPGYLGMALIGRALIALGEKE